MKPRQKIRTSETDKASISSGHIKESQNELVCIAMKKVIVHPNAVQSRHWTKGRSFWQQRNFVSTARDLPIGHLSVEVLQRASIVTKGIIPQCTKRAQARSGDVCQKTG